jgi:hypothetical protein
MRQYIETARITNEVAAQMIGELQPELAPAGGN